MVHANGYVAVVRAKDFVGLTVEATSNEFIVDDTPPIAGWVSIVIPPTANNNMTQIASRYDYTNTFIDNNAHLLLQLARVNN